jgi:hypothetical protein
MPVKGGYLLLGGIGAVFAYSGLRGKGISDSIRSILGGDSPSSAATVNPISGAAASGSSAGTILTGGSGGGSSSQNQALAKLLAVGSGHPDWVAGSEWQDWVNLWNQESGWDQYADNPSSNAYGIPQALPYTKMPKAAWPASAGGSSNPTAQISWGIAYISATYGSPSGAWAHEQANNWY